MRVDGRIRAWLTGRGSDPSVRLRYWTEVEPRPASDRRRRNARRALGHGDWAEAILADQFPDGHWVTTGSSGEELYRPKYVATNWRAIVLADLGLARDDPRIRRAAEIILRRWSARGGDLSGQSGEICVTGNAVRTLLRFGYRDHPVVQRSIAWILRTQKRDGGWHCFPSRTGTLDGWEGLAALAEIPLEQRTAGVQQAIGRGAEFYLRRELMNEGPTPYPPWFRIHYPNHYYYDLLVGLRTLVRLGYARDARLRPALRWLKHQRRADGTWALDRDHPDLEPEKGGYSIERPIFPFRLEAPGVPSRWATVTALGVLAAVDAS